MCIAYYFQYGWKLNERKRGREREGEREGKTESKK